VVQRNVFAAGGTVNCTAGAVVYDRRVSFAVDAVFIAQVVLLAGLVAWRRPRWVGFGIAGWLALLAVLAHRGTFVGGTMPLRVALALVVPLAVGLVLLPTHGMRHYLAVTPPAWLISTQSFRIVMELVLFALAVQRRAPTLITFQGRNADILIGLTALPVAYFAVSRHRWPGWVATVWNVVGILVLANVVLHAQLAAPGPYRVFMTEPSTAFLGTFPYIWLPGFLVPLALWLHVASLLQLKLRRV
jgi:hypothetical protein